jgi:hypothetical protein
LTTATAAPNDKIYCSGYAKDTGGLVSAALDSSALTLDNRRPTMTSTVLTHNGTGAVVYNTNTLTCTLAATDDDGNTGMTFNTHWYKNGTTWFESGWSATATATLALGTGTTHASPGDTLYCRGFARDTSGTANNTAFSTASGSVTLDNRNPTVTTPTFSVTTLYNDTTDFK